MAHYKPTGVCATSLDFDLANDGTVHNVCFTRGCDGNAKGIAKLVEGRPAQEVVTCLEGITCGTKKTSCPDQLAKALKDAGNRAGN